jgi:DNA-binding NarL/FixJ family response regulator
MTAEESPVGACVLLVDDHPIVRSGIAVLIEESAAVGHCVGVDSPAEAIAALPTVRPDLVIVDIQFPEENGLDLVRYLGENFPDTAVLVVSMYDEMLYASRAMALGASGYVMKHEAVHVLEDAVVRALEGGAWLSERMAMHMAKQLQVEPTPIESLSDRELEVFMSIGQGLSTREIADRTERSVKTIETYRARIKKKLDLHTAAELMHYAVSYQRAPATSS